ncbi:PQQ-binding-like beta-propeller repeat protein [Streptomyces sp. NA04227]|uniref:serine/threonine-protein kinase n=1 Tax=Streptomyces sp. NA04227 TaxID=2742136 RepID=UPI0015911742|nr:serine/threonine-protein kinase [Streptomyces sp. NA04227]QKW08332.1 PQQ-binding-like beta-propeller repeat protein [Streptomyces sp. NA04227]
MAPQRSIGTGTDAKSPEFAGRYRLEARLGSGGMGVVHLARSDSGLNLAVKVVHTEFARDPEFRRRFRQEVTAARRVSGAFTAPVVDADPDAERPWMATLYIPGPTLAEQVKRNGPLAPAMLRRLMAGLAEALRDIHRAGVVHRDLKPSNVLLADDGPKVIDFGISRPKDSELRTETGKLIGSPPYMAPEQFRRPREVGPAADIFALGSLMVHAATGKAPWDSDSPYLVAYQVVHDEADLSALPESLVPLVEACLSKDPEHRPTADELMSDLRGIAASYDTQAFIPAQRTARHPDGGSGSWSPVEDAGAEAGAGAGAHSGGTESSRTESPRTDSSSTDSSRTGNSSTGKGSSRDASRTDDSRTDDAEPPSVNTAHPTPRNRKAIVLSAIAAAVAACAVAGSLLWPGGEKNQTADGRPVGGERAAFEPWHEDLPGGSADALGATPLCSYAEGAVYCTQPGLPGAALDSLTGKLRWGPEAKNPSGPDATADAGSTPVLAPRLMGSLVYTLSEDGRTLLALDRDTGQERRATALSSYGDSGATGSSGSSASYGTSLRFASGTVVLGGADGTVTGIDPVTGKQRWRQPVAGQLAPALSLFGDSQSAGGEVVFVARQSRDGLSTRVTALDARSGDPRWEHPFAGVVRPIGVDAKGEAVLMRIGTDGRTDELVRYRSADRSEQRVRLRLPVDEATAAVHGDRAYLVASGGAVVAVDLAAGRQVWRTETAVSEGSAPVADAGQVYFSAPDGRLLALAADDGHPLGQTRARGALATDRVVARVPTPVLAGGQVYASAPDGSVFAVNKANPAVW